MNCLTCNKIIEPFTNFCSWQCQINYAKQHVDETDTDAFEMQKAYLNTDHNCDAEKYVTSLFSDLAKVGENLRVERNRVYMLRETLKKIVGEYGDCTNNDEIFEAAHDQDFGDHVRFVMHVITTARAALLEKL